MEAQRVPPSASMTSQSRVKVRAPSCERSTDARSARPMSRWISCVRPLCLPFAASRAERVWVLRGSMPYSAVTQPLAFPRRCGGTRSSTEQVTRTQVWPMRTSAEPSACRDTPGVMVSGRRSSGPRSKERMDGRGSFAQRRPGWSNG
jgi:hypothetical protein